MSGTGLMAIGTKALTANYLALTTTGHNIANANVAGYSRQQVVLTPAQGQYTGAGYVGKGVDVITVQRAHDAFLARGTFAVLQRAYRPAWPLRMFTTFEDAERFCWRVWRDGERSGQIDVAALADRAK